MFGLRCQRPRLSHLVQYNASGVSGRMRAMPRLSMPADMPLEVQAIIDVIGNSARTEILRILTRQPMSAVDLAAVLEVHHASVHRHLTKLESYGLVAATAAAGQRRGNKHVVWSTVPERVSALGAQWVAYATDRSDDLPH